MKIAAIVLGVAVIVLALGLAYAGTGPRCVEYAVSRFNTDAPLCVSARVAGLEWRDMTRLDR